MGAFNGHDPRNLHWRDPCNAFKRWLTEPFDLHFSNFTYVDPCLLEEIHGDISSSC